MAKVLLMTINWVLRALPSDPAKWHPVICHCRETQTAAVIQTQIQK